MRSYGLEISSYLSSSRSVRISVVSKDAPIQICGNMLSSFDRKEFNDFFV